MFDEDVIKENLPLSIATGKTSFGLAVSNAPMIDMAVSYYFVSDSQVEIDIHLEVASASAAYRFFVDGVNITKAGSQTYYLDQDTSATPNRGIGYRQIVNVSAGYHYFYFIVTSGSGSTNCNARACYFTVRELR